MENSSRENQSSNFTDVDLRRLQQETFVEQVEFHSALDSTNDRALQVASTSSHRLPLLVLTENQTAGRGRGTNRWWGAEGALTFSLLMESKAERLPSNQWPQMSLTAGLAIGEALERFLPDADVRLKWPNDVYADGRKICGLLIESPPTQQAKFVLGVGVNVNNSLTNAPSEIAKTATSLCDLAHRDFRLVEVLLAILTQIAKRFAWLGTRDSELLDLWKKRCLLAGKQVQIDTSTGPLSGVCDGIDSAGALLVQTENGTHRCFSGSVTLLDTP